MTTFGSAFIAAHHGRKVLVLCDPNPTEERLALGPVLRKLEDILPGSRFFSHLRLFEAWLESLNHTPAQPKEETK